ncbi:MAG: formate--tetrahydrofolate ligase [Bacteroidales bacterium]|nr:formate--tetrahydrofolate ligase [Bacteroidales bacterium]MDD4001549.1 formate--tetrahydrofolate ligase [Bacteroidales bacterium]MDD4529257.1 formate--tetrahydrofolate ligase [Bacteroidales bacterium]
MKTDLEIAREYTMLHIRDMAAKVDVCKDNIEYYGKYKAKLPLNLIDEEKVKASKLVLVTAITPTPAGEGKTTVSIGLAQALNRIGKKTTVVLREPSLGPVFGIKGGATGGGYAQVVPMEDINLHFTGDFAAIEKAHNLLSAIIDNNIQNKKNNLCLDPRTVRWSRVMDMNDRSLRNIVIGLGGISSGIPRESGFKITAASEIMAILCMSSSIKDLKERLGNIFIGYTFEKKPIFARDLKANGAMAALLKEAIKPNLVQTTEGTPAIIHGGPFANIAQGTNTIIGTKMGMSLSDIVVTEAGFGADLGAEKFIDIKCRESGLRPNAIVLVATVRALRYHGGVSVKDSGIENLDALKSGIENLEKHIENIKLFGINPIVAINKFANDSEQEIDFIKNFCENHGVKAFTCEVWAKGGEGAIELAQEVERYIQVKKEINFIYEKEDTIEEKVKKIATKLYGAKKVEFSTKASSDIKKINELGLANLPICMAKTQKSISDDPNLRGKPKDFTFKVREVEISSGAGFIIPISGEIMLMPGLPEIPSSETIDIDDDGNIIGLS